MITSIIALLTAYKSVLLPIFAALLGYLLPSPLQRQQKIAEQVHNKETQVDEGTSPTSDLDKLP